MTLSTTGYALLRQVLPTDWLPGLQAAFDAHVLPSHAWPVPRGPDWRHAQLDHVPHVLQACRHPRVLSAVGALIGAPFLLGQVEGREPVAGGGYQGLHRDLSMHRPGDTVSVLVFLDDYGPHNGATRLVAGSHRARADATTAVPPDADAQVLSGCAGDVLVFDADLLHAAGCNTSGARRRSLLAGYFAQECAPALAATAPLRGVRMDTSARYAVDGTALPAT